jgi:hypothetical protein
MTSPLSGRPSLTDCGVPGIKQVLYGTHLCHFYLDRQELVQSLVPFFQAGLLNNERCLWVTAEPLLVAEAQMELAQVVPDVEVRIAAGQLRIIDGREWYESSRGVTGNDLIARWLEEEAEALNAGYTGLRVTGNTSFLTPETWRAFMEYEELVNKAFENRRIVALCSYDLSRCRSWEVLGVIGLHHHTLVQVGDSWEILQYGQGV